MKEIEWRVMLSFTKKFNSAVTVCAVCQFNAGALPTPVTSLTHRTQYSS